ncbi:MAG: hypothetical protein KAS75_00080 [Planctomycetes bacterium]|nr:hypothetical protein [Planctomycetota bacterium]
MNIEEIVARLKEYANCSEVYQKTTFECIRANKDGNTQKIEVSIFDAGPNRPEYRYHCVANSEGGKMATGNPDFSIDMAILGVHWNNLD